MFGNGAANIAAAAIIAGALLWTGGTGKSEARLSDEEIARVYARAVGDIRNDIVVNCGCCGDDDGSRRADAGPF